MNIGEAARATGLSAKMIRHYEALGLLPKAARTLAGYRRYEARDLQTLAFIRRARNAGFSLTQIRKLLALWRNEMRPAREVHALASEHLADLNAKIAELQAVADALAHLVAHCHGDDRPECPIVEAFASEEMSGKEDQEGLRRAGTTPNAKDARTTRADRGKLGQALNAMGAKDAKDAKDTRANRKDARRALNAKDTRMTKADRGKLGQALNAMGAKGAKDAKETRADRTESGRELNAEDA